MSINLRMPETTELKPRITVFGVGGAGGNAVNNMIESNLQGVEFVAANADAQALHNSRAERAIQIGTAITEGLGAGSRPEVGRAAAEESLPEIIDNLVNTHMVFITAGMGGGTGTGAAPVIAQAAREQGILTVGVVTKPFQFEGARRMRIAEAGIEELQQYVDTLIIIPNQNLFRVANEKTTFADAFSMADQVLHSGVRGITDLMVMPGLINLDFADVRTVMDEMGKAMMGTGEATGEKRALEAAEAAISNPLLDEVSMKGARGVLINITGGMDLTLFEVDEAANRIRTEVDPEANIIVGSTFDENMEGPMRVSVVATGINAEEMSIDRPTDQVVTPLKPRGTTPWRGGAGKSGPTTTTSAVGSAAVATEADPAAEKMEIAPPQEEAPVFTPEAEGVGGTVKDQLDAINQVAETFAPQNQVLHPNEDGSSAPEIVKQANQFATRGQPQVPPATPARTEEAPVQTTGAAPKSEPTAPTQEAMLPGFEMEDERPRAPRKPKGGFLRGLRRKENTLFKSEKPVETRIEPEASKPEPKPAGMPDAPKVALNPGDQLDQSIQGDDLEIPTFLRRPTN